MFILFNGPPRSGKDTAAEIAYNYLVSQLKPVIWEKFSRPNKEAFAAMCGAEIDDRFTVTEFESIKERPLPWLGVSYRQWQIDFSEKFMKPLYGKRIFGELLLQRCTAPNTVFVVSDCGFQVEVDCLKDEPCMLIVMHRDGCTFEGDSRQYVKPAINWRYHSIYNNGSLDDLRKWVELLVRDYVRP